MSGDVHRPDRDVALSQSNEVLFRQSTTKLQRNENIGLKIFMRTLFLGAVPTVPSTNELQAIYHDAALAPQ
jgi:hypothetical protein